MFALAIVVSVWGAATGLLVANAIVKTGLIGKTVNFVKDLVTPNSPGVQTKKKLTEKDETIIGIREPSLINPSALVPVKFDTTTYSDRAVFQLENTGASNVVITGLSIHGKLVVKSAGKNGYLWEYADYDSIDKHGEQFFEVSNDFMTDPIQVEAIGDFCWKTLKPHNVYQLAIVGCQHQYSIGDFYQLKVDYQLSGAVSQIESIDVPVEVMNVSFSRQVGEVGQTLLTVRQQIGTWNKTTSRRARLIGAGLPQVLLNRGNSVTVASSTWTGQADYYCDGVNDQEEIQAAIDFIKNAGGGSVELTEGSFIVSATITVDTLVKVQGVGVASVLLANATNLSIFTLSGKAEISSLTINGNNPAINNGNTFAIVNGVSSYNGICRDILVTNYRQQASPGGTIFAFRYVDSCIGCIVENLVTSGSNAVNVIRNSNLLSNVKIRNIENNGAFAAEIIAASVVVSSSIVSNCSGSATTRCFVACGNMSSCSSIFNSLAAGTIVGYASCSNMSSCLFSNNTAASTLAFANCKNITASSSISNTSTAFSSIGFQNCFSLQQCSTTDTNKYSGSYASAVVNATYLCADTPNGGFNS
jgi:hypothetical protein